MHEHERMLGRRDCSGIHEAPAFRPFDDDGRALDHLVPLPEVEERPSALGQLPEAVRDHAPLRGERNSLVPGGEGLRRRRREQIACEIGVTDALREIVALFTRELEAFTEIGETLEVPQIRARDAPGLLQAWRM